MPHRHPQPITRATHRTRAKAHQRIEARPASRYDEAIIAGFVVSIVLHAFIVLSSFIPAPNTGSKQEDRGLQIVLVNAKHALRPHDAQAIAQANLDGGGNTQQPDLATSPLPPEHADLTGDAMTDASRRVESLEARQRALLNQLNSKAILATAPGHLSDQKTSTDIPKTGDALEDKTRAMVRQEAVVNRLLRQYAQRPRKSIVAPRTRESRFAIYAETWRKAVEEMGTLKFPKGPDGQPIYGSVMLSIDIDREGKLTEVKVERSSGTHKLDEAAVRIVHLASPFQRFPPEIARDTDILELVRTFVFQQTLGETTLDVHSGQTP